MWGLIAPCTPISSHGHSRLAPPSRRQARSSRRTAPAARPPRKATLSQFIASSSTGTVAGDCVGNARLSASCSRTRALREDQTSASTPIRDTAGDARAGTSDDTR
jgi:hypothetical protein